MSALSAFVYTISEKRDKKATDLKKKKKKNNVSCFTASSFPSCFQEEFPDASFVTGSCNIHYVIETKSKSKNG